MTHHAFRPRLQLIAAATLILCGIDAHAQLVINDTLTGASTKFDWKPLNGACLTAGDDTGTIKKCVGLSYYGTATQVGGTTGRLPDVAGSGALRLTNGAPDNGSGGTNQTGAVVSNFTFPTSEGVQVTWTSVSYGGNNYNSTGADGLSFFLSSGGGPVDKDGKDINPKDPHVDPTVGALGGSLGYSCSNVNGTYDGVVAGYIGIGIDEYGNFMNPGDNTDTGPGFKAGRIGMRGAGYTAWSALSRATLPDGSTNPYAKYYKSGNQGDAIHNTCSSGYAYNYSGGSIVDGAGNTISSGGKTGDKLPNNYPKLYSLDLPTGVSLANQEAIDKPLRGNAVPIIFALKITSDGLLDFSYSVCPASSCGATQTVVTGLKITDSNGPLPSSFRFGFSAGTGGGSNVHEITCFKATPANLSSSSAASDVQQSGQIVLGGVQVFLAYYHPINWWGSLTANTLTFNATLNRLETSPATWDGSCKLTGGSCPSMVAAGAKVVPTVAVQAPTLRKIITWDNGASSGGQGIAFEWPSSGGVPLSSTEQTTLGSADRVNYLRGDRTKEISKIASGFRNRTSVLGDIIDSSPVYVGPPAFNYEGPWVDKLNAATTLPEASTANNYTKFETTWAGRMNVVYVGANDGMMHAFQAGTIASDLKTINNNTGDELLAYVPGQVINSIHPSAVAYDYSDPSYLHNFYVDGTAGTGDLFYSGNWHTWIVQGLGAGGHPGGAVNSNGVDGAGKQLIPDPVGALFALEVTDPDNTFTEANAKNIVQGEWNSSTISCTGNLTCGTNMGQVVGTPLIRRLHDGSWGVIWGNGLNSKTARAGIFIMHVDSSGSKTFQYIDAGAGPANGIVEVASADLDGDHITDFVYAGDVLGNLWRFDLTSTTNTVWNTSVKNLFTTASGQPISTAPVISEIPAANGGSGLPKLLIAFGTGQKRPLTSAASEGYASGTQSLYGVWDASMSAWNATTTTEKYDSIATPTLPIVLSLLTGQTTTAFAGADGSTYRTVSVNTLCWLGSTACSSGNTQMGWKLDLPLTGEQVIYSPKLIDDTFTINTLIPQSVQPLTCGSTPASGFTMSIDIVNGSGDNPPYSDGTTDASGVSQNGAGVVSNYNFNNESYDGTSTNDGSWISRHRRKAGGTVTRLTWTKVR